MSLDSTLLNYLKTLRCPAGAPLEGWVSWQQRDLFGLDSHVKASWTPDSLCVEGHTNMKDWSMTLTSTADGWACAKVDGDVSGGTALAKIRWAHAQAAATGANPVSSWVIPKARRSFSP